MTDSPKPITFVASFPAIASAIIISGNGDGLRVKLDIPEVELMNALSLLAMRQEAFQVTIEPLNEQRKQHGNTRKSTY